MLQITISNKWSSFELSIRQKILKKYITDSTKILSNTMLIIINVSWAGVCLFIVNRPESTDDIEMKQKNNGLTQSSKSQWCQN